MPKAMIVTVGAQGEQIIFALKEIKPRFLGLLATDTEESKNAVNAVLENYKMRPTDYKILYCQDGPSQIGRLIHNFNDIYRWLTEEEKIPADEILIDPTGGRKWMSSGVTMFASFLGLNMIYVDARYREGRPDPLTMKIVELENAYEQTGFLEENKADKLFNEYNFSVASSIYDFLSRKIKDPRRVEIKKEISEAYLSWGQFRFKQATSILEDAIRKIKQYELLLKYLPKLESNHRVLEVLKKSDESDIRYYNLLKDDNFAREMLLTLVAQSERLAEQKQYDQAVIILYRILEFVAQFRLAKNNIDAGKISQQIRDKYNEQYRKITKEIFQAESEIPDKIALVQCWILLYCLEDGLVKKEKGKFIKGLRKKTELRNLLWWEHGNKTVEEKDYKEFRGYVLEHWLSKVFRDWGKLVYSHYFIKF